MDVSLPSGPRVQPLALQWFRNRTEVKVSIEQWRRHYNEVRPHSSLGYLTPAAFKAKHLADVDGGRSLAQTPARADRPTERRTTNRSDHRHSPVTLGPKKSGRCAPPWRLCFSGAVAMPPLRAIGIVAIRHDVVPRRGYRSEAQRIALRSSVLNALFWNRSALCPNWKYTFRPL